jgi:hypothetical protein
MGAACACVSTAPIVAANSGTFAVVTKLAY